MKDRSRIQLPCLLPFFLELGPARRRPLLRVASVKSSAQRRARFRPHSLEETIHARLVQRLQRPRHYALDFFLREPGGESIEDVFFFLSNAAIHLLLAHRCPPNSGILSRLFAGTKEWTLRSATMRGTLSNQFNHRACPLAMKASPPISRKQRIFRDG